MTDPLTCPLCRATGDDPCIALDYRPLPTDHEERRRAAAVAQEATPVYATLVADTVCGDALKPYAGADHGPWSLRAYDDLDGSVLRLVLTRDGAVVKEGRCDTYKVWTVLAHWTEDLPVEEPARG